MQLLLQFYFDSFETLQEFRSWSADVHIFWIKSSDSFCHFLSHLSRRLMGELIVYQSFWRPSVVRPSIFSNISSETTGPIKIIFHAETKVCSNSPGHMTKMAATPIYDKKPLNSSPPEPESR